MDARHGAQKTEVHRSRYTDYCGKVRHPPVDLQARPTDSECRARVFPHDTLARRGRLAGSQSRHTISLA